MKGQPLHQGFKGVVWSIIGDTSISAILLGYHTGLPITHAGSVMQRISLHVPLGKGTKRSVWKSRSLRSTPMKIAWWTHGVTMRCSNSLAPAAAWSHTWWGGFCTTCVIMFEGPGVRTAKKPTERLPVLFSQVQVHDTQQQCKNRLTNLRLSMICDPSKPWSKHPVLDRKGGESRHLLPALTPVLQSVFARTTEICEVEMLNAATSLKKLVQLWDDIGLCHTPAEYEEILSLGGSFLKSYAWLNAWSLEKDRMSFHVVAKHHSFLHLLWNHSVSMGVSPTKLSSKVVGKYRILAHLFLTRSMQEMVEGYTDY